MLQSQENMGADGALTALALASQQLRACVSPCQAVFALKLESFTLSFSG